MTGEHSQRWLCLVAIGLAGCGGPANTDDDAGRTVDAGRLDGGTAHDDAGRGVDGGPQCDGALCCLDNLACDDGEMCNGSETCSTPIPGQCQPGANLDDGTECTTASGGGACRAGHCVPVGCGNGTLDPGEHCEDGNTTPMDGCEIDCRYTCEVQPGVMLNRWFVDCDGDDFASATSPPQSDCLAPAPDACGGGWTLRTPVSGASDCDDTRADIHPGVAEVCDGADNDCNSMTDDGSNGCGGICPLPNPLGGACDGPDADLCTDDSYVCAGSNSVACSPGADNGDVCDGLDNDCSGGPDTGLACVRGSALGCTDTCGSPTGTGTCSSSCAVPAAACGSSSGSDCCLAHVDRTIYQDTALHLCGFAIGTGWVVFCGEAAPCFLQYGPAGSTYPVGTYEARVEIHARGGGTFSFDYDVTFDGGGTAVFDGGDVPIGTAGTGISNGMRYTIPSDDVSRVFTLRFHVTSGCESMQFRVTYRGASTCTGLSGAFAINYTQVRSL